MAAYAYKADPPPPHNGFTVLAIHLVPNITIQADTLSDPAARV